MLDAIQWLSGSKVYDGHSFDPFFPGNLKWYLCSDAHLLENYEMPTSTTKAIRLDPQLKEKLGRWADGIRRSRSYLAAEAVESYVGRELAI